MSRADLGAIVRTPGTAIELRRRSAYALDARDGHECFYCGGPAEHIDHLLPVSRGGSDDIVNLVWACKPCNLSKGYKTPGEFAAARKGCRLGRIPKPHRIHLEIALGLA